MLGVASEHPDYVVMAAADPGEAAVEAARAVASAARFSADPAEVIDADDIDAVYIACPPKFHAAYAIAAMRNGKAVFCEKPLAIDVAEGEEMVRVARETNSVTAMNFALADRHAVLEIQRAIRAGEAGEIRSVETRLNFPRWVRDFQAGAAWLEKREQGGFVREVYSHFAFLTDKLFGDATVDFTRSEFDPGVSDGSETFAFGLFKAGEIPVTVTARSGVAVPESYEYFVYGSRRSYCLKDWGTLLTADDSGWTPVELQGERGSEYTRLTAFARKIRGEAEPNLPDLATGLRVQKLVEAFHHASE